MYVRSDFLITGVQAKGAFGRYRSGIFAGCDPNVRSEYYH